uniref:Uncharacterized protein n=1 Tax=Wolbachia endosymbiont of Aleurodicus floccissimus TaxID=2152762 RepID=A0A3B0JHR9_9RICK
MVDILKLRLKDIDNFNSSGDSFDVKLKNGAGCSFDKSNLKCSYNTQRFNEQIEIENIKLKPSEKEASSETNKTFNSKVTDDTKVTYNIEYPNSKSGTSGSLNATIAFQEKKNYIINEESTQENDNDIVIGKSTVSMKGLGGSLKKGDNRFFINDEKVQAIIKAEEESFKLENRGAANSDIGSKLEIESVDQIDPESKSGSLEYNDIYQIRYYTEPYGDHNLEINVF